MGRRMAADVARFEPDGLLDDLGVLEARVAARKMKSLGHLRRVVQEEWDKLPMTIVRAAIDSWPDRIRRCIRKRGGRFEK